MSDTKRTTGYPSIDKPWLKHYSKKQIDFSLPDYSLYEYLWECNKEHLEDYAINYFGKKIKYRKLFLMIDEVAKSFLAIGVREKEIVPIISVSTVTSVILFYALNRIGAVSDFLNVLSEEKDLTHYFDEAEAKTVVTMNLFKDKTIKAAKKSKVKRIITFDVSEEMPIMVSIGFKIKTLKMNKSTESFSGLLSWKQFIKKSSEINNITTQKNPNEMCLLAHTGGTTGTPKAVMLSDKAMNIVANYYRLCFDYTRGEVWANVMIPFVVYGILTCLHMPLTLGLTTVIIPKFDDNKWDSYLKKYKINYILAVPSYVNVFYENNKYKNLDLSNLKLCGVGGDGMTSEKEKNINDYFKNHGADIQVVKGYGMSEVCATAITGLKKINKIGSVGIPLIHNNIMIYDQENKCELGYEKIGEICIQSPSRMIGYLRDEEATDELFRKHKDGSEWLHTGDLGYIDEDGFIFLVGRMKRVILTTKDGVAYKVFPNMIEVVLDSHKLVVQSCVVGATDGNDQVLRAYIVLSKDELFQKNIVEKELRTICGSELPSYSRPTFYVFCEALPLTAVGKVDYQVLEER